MTANLKIHFIYYVFKIAKNIYFDVCSISLPVKKIEMEIQCTGNGF